MIEGTFYHQPHVDGHNTIVLLPSGIRRPSDELVHRHGAPGVLLTREEYDELVGGADYQVGYDQGYAEGKDVGHDLGYQAGHTDGYEDGRRDSGYDLGYSDGQEEAKRERSLCDAERER